MTEAPAADASTVKFDGVNNLVTDFISFPKKLGDFVKFNFKPFKNGNNASTSELAKRAPVSSTLDLSLEKQIAAWKDNPVWVDHPPKIKVTVPKGSLCNMSLQVDVGLPPDAVYNIVTDPENKRVFKNIKEVISRKVLVDQGLRQVVEVEQAAIWRFLWWSGTISVHVVVDQNRENHTMKFKQIKSGFMKRFEGLWQLEPLFIDEELCNPTKPNSVKEYISCTKGRGRIASRVRLEQLIQPSIVSPPPISWYVRGITAKTTEMMINDLIMESARIRTSDDDINESAKSGGDACNVKERWRMRRKRSHRRLQLDSKPKPV